MSIRGVDLRSDGPSGVYPGGQRVHQGCRQGSRGSIRGPVQRRVHQGCRQGSIRGVDMGSKRASGV